MTSLFPDPNEMHKSARISKCGTFRWTLKRSWGGGALAVWLMLNPSTADGTHDDPTIKRCINFTRAWGYPGFVVVNLYPFRSPSPAELWKWADWERNGPDWYARDAIHRNAGVIEAAGRAAAVRVVAFGAQPVQHDQAWLEECLEAFRQPSDISADETLYCLGVNSTGQPLHPMARGKMRVPDDATLQVWRGA